jgi:hypothetical protein
MIEAIDKLFVKRSEIQALEARVSVCQTEPQILLRKGAFDTP